MKTTILLAILFAAVLGGGFWYASLPSAAPAAPVVETTQPAPTTATNTPAAPGPAAGTYTSAQVAQHATAESCWTSISGSVYDLTSWINQHPGGEGAILSICGKDGTSAFLSQHAGDRRAEQELATFKIGTLAP
jgi:hypothetical protein